MKNFNFCYNYGFLRDWLKTNPKIKRYDVLAEMEMSYYRTLQNWMEGVTMMPLTQMMKFCNRYNVPITAFFFDANADDDSIFTSIPPGAMIEPAGGWIENDRKTGIKTGDPRTDIHIPSNLPKYCKSINLQHNICDSDVKKDIKEKEVTHSERMRYLDIIEQQHVQIVELSRKTLELQQKIIDLEQQCAAHIDCGIAADELRK
jgi:hypothetical protein